MSTTFPAWPIIGGGKLDPNTTANGKVASRTFQCVVLKNGTGIWFVQPEPGVGYPGNGNVMVIAQETPDSTGLVQVEFHISTTTGGFIIKTIDGSGGSGGGLVVDVPIAFVILKIPQAGD